jgi:hypothetical protein
MSALESLSNPLERLATLPTAVQARSNGVGDITWDATLQYYRGDLAISALTGGAYIFTGGASERSAILGGLDPVLEPTLWTRLQGDGLSSVSVFDGAGPFNNAGGGAAYVFPAGASILAPEGSTWLCVVQGTNTNAGGAAGVDYATFTFNANGVGAVDASVSPLIPTTSPSTFSASATVFVGIGGTSITFTGVAVGIAQALSALRVSYIRVA